MQIATNTAALGLSNEMRKNQIALTDRMSVLGSGKRIQSASDDAANLQISNRLGSLTQGMKVAIRNANDGISIAQTAEGAAQEITNMLQRMRELSIQSANATNSDNDRNALQQEIGQLKSEINRIAENTSFGGQYLLNGSFGSQLFQVGAEANETISIALGSLSSSDITHNEYDLAGQATNSVFAGVSLNGAQTALSNGFGGAASETLTIEGLETKTVDVSSSSSVKDIAADINALFEQTGIKATVNTSVALHVHSGIDTARVAFDAGEDVSFELGNGSESVTIAFTATGDLTNDLATLANKVNENSVLTGIGAEVDNTNRQIVLTSFSGDNVEISDYTESSETTDNQLAVRAVDYDGNFSAATSLANDGSAAIVRGSITLNSISNFSLTSDLDFGLMNNAAGRSGTSFVSKESTIADIDITTLDGAQNAISALDTAISYVDSMRAMLGAIQNRFSSSVNSMSVTNENVTSAQSRLIDSDFSKEAAELAKLQVTQQAATALLGQANSMKDQAIRLLG